MTWPSLMFADLHLHTCFSDGTFTPSQLATLARSHGLSAIALTDHDTVAGCAPAADACAREGLEFLPGTELTAEVDGNEIHLLGYGLDTSHPRLLSETVRYQTGRQARIREMVTRLNRLNIPLQAEAVFALAACQSPGRPHVGRALVQGGYCATLDEAFERFLKKHRPAWVPKCHVSAADAIALIHEAGGVAVLAHPGLNRNDSVIPWLADQGLDGLECYHTKHSTAASESYVRLAEELELAVTGGSDCHGLNKGLPLIGTVKVPYTLVEKLMQRINAVRNRVAEAKSAAAS